MKQFILLFLLFFSINAYTQNVYIPDANFKAALLANTAINTNRDTEIQISEATTFTGTINVSFLYITNLNGIEAFVNITELDCSYNKLTSIDVTKNTTLTFIKCNSNQLTALDIYNNTALTFLDCSQNLITSLDITKNTALTFFGCSENQLTSIDVSKNTSLIYLYIFKNYLTSLDISNNTSLIELKSYSNQLVSLNVSKNIALIKLICFANQLISLDITKNNALTDFFCGSNNLTTLDISKNTLLTTFHCENNPLTSLNIRNGNNKQLTSLNVTSNPKLYCIQVDDVAYALSKWKTDVNATASFSTDCNLFYGATDSIAGKVVFDTNCNLEGNEIALPNTIVKSDNYTFYSTTDINGIYSLKTATSIYNIQPVITNPLLKPICPISGIHTIQFDTLNQDTSNINFHYKQIACPLLKTDMSSNRKRRCFRNTTIINYLNDGFADAENVKVFVKLPRYVNLISADKAFTIDEDSNLVFDIGTLQQQKSGQIKIVDSISCIEGITGLTQCTKVWITPVNNCLQKLDTVGYATWDKSSLQVEGKCLNDSVIQFIVTNTGSDMQYYATVRIYANNQLGFSTTIKLKMGLQKIFNMSADGKTYRLEADQHPNHPGNSRPRASVEACGNQSKSSNFGFIVQVPTDDADYEIEEECLPIRDSYDPNEKEVSPSGISLNNYVKNNSPLDYVIHFQNTGSDTAYKIVIVDTLSQFLDISTIEWGVASAPYLINVSGMGNPILTFTFNNINLPDSTTDEVNSHGFVKFKISPIPSLPPNSIILNSADIYFDYNLPIRTNETRITINDTVIQGDPISVDVIASFEVAHTIDFLMMPNPFNNVLTITLPYCNVGTKFFMYDLVGRQTNITSVYTGNTIQLNTSSLSSGIYFIELSDHLGNIGRAKVVKR